jgi:hypothetical protein
MTNEWWCYIGVALSVVAAALSWSSLRMASASRRRVRERLDAELRTYRTAAALGFCPQCGQPLPPPLRGRWQADP